jgi:hypothetical protein
VRLYARGDFCGSLGKRCLREADAQLFSCKLEFFQGDPVVCYVSGAVAFGQKQEAPVVVTPLDTTDFVRHVLED